VHAYYSHTAQLYPIKTFSTYLDSRRKLLRFR